MMMLKMRNMFMMHADEMKFKHCRFKAYQVDKETMAVLEILPLLKLYSIL